MIKCITAPCKGCEKRVVGCHAGCPDYISFTEKIKMVKEKERNDKLYSGYISIAIYNMRKHKELKEYRRHK